MLLLDQLRHTLQRDSLKDDLESKRLTIFQHFLGDLEVVSRSYEKLKNNPPLVRNVPPVTSNVLWARQLMRRIESPMQQFRNHQELMDLKDSKKAVKVYNKIARTVVEFEALWELAWVRGIEAAKSGLQSTLIVRHPTTDKLYVNFDHQILELMKEAKCLRRLGHEIPESAKMVLMMEDKYKHHYNLLSYALSEYERVMNDVPDILRPLLKPHMEELQSVINPGLVTLTWTSMNIASYLARFHSEMLRFSDLVFKLKDIVSNRLVRNQNIIRGLPLVEMPEEGTTLPLDKFISMQAKFATEQTVVMAAKSIETMHAVRDLVRQITEYELSYVPQQFSQSDIDGLVEHFSKTTYRAVLDCTKTSLDGLKTRIQPRSLSAFVFIDAPIFEINVEVTPAGAVMNPALEEISDAINASARTILGCSKSLPVWEDDDGYASGKRVFDVISRDKEIVRVVLLLTGAIEGTKRQVLEYLHTLSKYDYLWRDDKKAAYEAFMAKNPSLEDFEAELRKYDTVESEINRIPDKHNIGALSLDTTPLKTALAKEAQMWKKQYARNLHGQAKEELEAITQWIETHKRYLSREITDLEDVRNVMGYLAAIREKETMLDWEFGPVEEKYTMLTKYNVEVPKEEQNLVSDLSFSWKKLKKDADSITDRLGLEQAEFKKGLVRNVRMFVVDVAQFRSDFEANGRDVMDFEANGPKPSDKEFLRAIENAVRFGKPFVMENVLESLDPALEPVMLKKTFKQGGNIVMKIGDNTIPYHPDFKFYLTIKLPNPHYAPETSVKVRAALPRTPPSPCLAPAAASVCFPFSDFLTSADAVLSRVVACLNQVTLLNFTITQEGLEDQLLGITVAKERADLQELKDQLVISNAKMAAQLKDIESSILKLLSESSGNILDDEGLINTLAQSKVTSNEIEIKAQFLEVSAHPPRLYSTE